MSPKTPKTKTPGADAAAGKTPARRARRASASVVGEAADFFSKHLAREAAPTGFSVDMKGLVMNEQEQYGPWDFMRELVANVFDAGGMNCHVTVNKNRITVTGDGMPIVTLDQMTELFSARKRDEPTINVAGARRHLIGQKGRGRLSVLSTASEAVWQSAFGEFRVALKDGDLTTEARPLEGKATTKETIVTVTKQDGEYDVKEVRAALGKFFSWFGGTNFNITVNGESIPTREFSPSQYFLVFPRSSDLLQALGDAGIKGQVYAQNRDAYIAHLTPGKQNIAKAQKLGDSEENFRFVRVSLDFHEASGNKNAGSVYLSRLIPVFSESLFSSATLVADTNFNPTPARDNFAPWVRRGAVIIDAHNVRNALENSALAAIFDALGRNEYPESWNRISGEGRSRLMHFLYMKDMQCIPLPVLNNLEVEAYVYDGDFAQRRIVKFGELAQHAQTKKSVVFVGTSLYNSSVSSRISKGAVIIPCDQRDEEVFSIMLKRACKDVEVHRSDSPLSRSIVDLGDLRDYKDIGAKNAKERAAIKRVSQIISLTGLEFKEVNIASAEGKTKDMTVKTGFLGLVSRTEQVLERGLLVSEGKVYLIRNSELGKMLLSGADEQLVTYMVLHSLANSVRTDEQAILAQTVFGNLIEQERKS